MIKSSIIFVPLYAICFILEIGRIFCVTITCLYKLIRDIVISPCSSYKFTRM